jgi:hypothetical protein
MRTSGIRAIVLAVSALCPAAIVAQNLRGTILADDTGAPIGRATVLAIPKRTSLSESAKIYSAETDAQGRYAVTAEPGQYTICVHSAGLYLNPCQWNTAITRNVTTAPSDIPLRLTKGGRFVLRAHDVQRLLPRAEGIFSTGISAIVSRPSGGPYLLPVVYDNGRVRDYGGILPLNVALRVTVSSSRVMLSDQTGAALTPQGVPFQISASDFQYSGPVMPGFRRMFPPPDAKVVRIYVVGLR